LFESTEMIASRNGMRHTMRILTRNRCMDAKFSRSTAALEFVKKAIVHVRPPREGSCYRTPKNRRTIEGDFGWMKDDGAVRHSGASSDGECFMYIRTSRHPRAKASTPRHHFQIVSRPINLFICSPRTNLMSAGSFTWGTRVKDAWTNPHKLPSARIP